MKKSTEKPPSPKKQKPRLTRKQQLAELEALEKVAIAHVKKMSGMGHMSDEEFMDECMNGGDS